MTLLAVAAALSACSPSGQPGSAATDYVSNEKHEQIVIEIDVVQGRMLDTRTFYILPFFDADGGEAALTRHPAWPEHKPEEHNGRDLDGDGYIAQMRVKDPNGNYYPSRIDERLMLRVRSRDGGRWNFVPTTLEEPEDFERLAPPENRYHVHTEGASLIREVTDEREEANFNRNWSAEWQRHEPGAGPYPFFLPEVRAVAEFITSHPNIYFTYTIHSGGGARNYIVRPPMSHPFEYMSPEDNDFYTRLGAIWSWISKGGVMNNNWYAQEVKAGRYGETMHGFSNDWAYMQVGIHSLLPEISGAGRDYDQDGYGDAYTSTESCDEPSGYVTDDSDCDDEDDAVNPDGTEVCNGVDDDCDGETDEEDVDGNGGKVTPGDTCDLSLIHI